MAKACALAAVAAFGTAAGLQTCVWEILFAWTREGSCGWSSMITKAGDTIGLMLRNFIMGIYSK